MNTKRISRWAGMVAAVGAMTMLGVSTGLQDAAAQLPGDPNYQPDQGQQQQTEARHSQRSMSEHGVCRASDILGMDVRAKAGDENIGSIEDLMISRDGKVKYVAVSFGGFLGLGDKLFAVPPEAVEFKKSTGRGEVEDFARIDVTDQALRDKKGFDQDNWPNEADRSFLSGSASQRQAERPATTSDRSTQ